MKRIILASLIFAVPAMAQEKPQPMTEALSQMVIEAAQREAGLRAEIVALRQAMAEAKKAEPAKKE